MACKKFWCSPRALRSRRQGRTRKFVSAASMTSCHHCRGQSHCSPLIEQPLISYTLVMGCGVGGFAAAAARNASASSGGLMILRCGFSPRWIWLILSLRSGKMKKLRLLGLTAPRIVRAIISRNFSLSSSETDLLAGPCRDETAAFAPSRRLKLDSLQASNQV